MKRSILISFFVLVFVESFAAIGDWRTYLAYSEIQDIVSAGENIYVLSSNHLFSYNTEDNSITEYNKIVNLSDTHILKIAYCKSAKRLIVLYDNSNIDLIDDDGSVTNVSDIYRTTISDKTINNIDIYGAYAYLSTSFGVIKLNVRDAEISETYKLNSAITTVAEYNGKVIAAAKSGCYVGDINKNLIDPANWNFIESDVPVRFIVFNNKLLGYKWSDVYQMNPDNLKYNGTEKYGNSDVTHYSLNDNTLLLWNNSKIYFYEGSKDNRKELNIKDCKTTTALAYNKNTKSFWRDYNGEYLTSTVEYEGELKITSERIKPESPKRNNFGTLKIFNGNLYTCGAGYSSENELRRPATVQVLNSDYNWQIYQDNLDTITGYQFLDAKSIDIDPTNPSRLITGGRTGMYEYLDGKFVRAYNNEEGSLLQTVAGLSNNKSYVLSQAIKFDDEGNLWCYNSQAPSANLLELTANGEWKNHYFSELMYEENTSDQRSLGNVDYMIFDSRGYLWFCNNHWDLPSLFCYIPSQNKLYSYKTFINEDGTNVDPYYIRCISEDKDGNIWIGTNKGPLYLAESEFSATSPVFQQVKVPRNDGTSLADYLLSGVNITGIAIDDANRKWFSTSTNGIYEISADNIVELNNFTVSNSSLISNNIESIAYNPENGEVFFGTDKGLCSYISDSSEPSEDIDSKNIWAYPNPVSSEYNGLITVVGLTSNAQVKVVSTSGTLIAEGTSNGGSFTWDGTDKNGKRVASGVYIVYAATNDGKKGASCKIAIIK